MFRRDKDTKLDNEGVRRMREAIRQRLDQEGGEGTGEAADDDAYRSTTPTPAEPYGTPQTGSYEPRSGEAEYSFFSPAQQDQERGVQAVEPPSPAVTRESTWAPAAPATPPAPAQTMVAADTNWRGTLRSSGAIRIEGTFEGEIDTEQELYIGSDAQVNATVRALTIVVAGSLNGQIDCRERLEVLASGRVAGQIETTAMIVHEGAFIGGQLRMKGHAADTDEQTRPMLQRVR